MRSFSFYWFVCWQSPRSLDKLTSKCSCDLVFWVATRKQCLSGDLQSFPCLISKYSTLSLCLKGGHWLQSDKASCLKGCGGKVHNAFLCKPSSVGWFLLRLCATAAPHSVGCGGSWLPGAKQFRRLCAGAEQRLWEWCCVPEGLTAAEGERCCATEDPTRTLCTV